MKIIIDELNKDIIHLPDIQFCKLCDSKYGINKGIYNTIDEWFFRKGIINIIMRRFVILDFLEFSCDNLTKNTTSKKFKFGHGGLVLKLEKYYFQFDIEYMKYSVGS